MYLFTFLLLFGVAFYEINREKDIKYKPFLIILVGWLIIHDGLRWGIGTDWTPYYKFFQSFLQSGEYQYFEVGYTFLNKLVYFYTDNYSVFLVLHAIIVYGLIAISIYKYSVNPLVTLFIFYCLMLSYLGMNRQYIALAICIFSFQFIFNKKIIPFILCIATAFLFHRSSLIFLPAYFLHRVISPKIIIYTLVVALGISASNIINHIPSGFFYLFGHTIGQRMEGYYGIGENVFIYSLLGTLKRCFWIFFALIFSKWIKNKDEYYHFFLNLYFLGAILYVIFNNTILQVIVGRGLIYFNIGEIFLIPYLLSIFRQRRIALCLVAVYCAIIIEKGFNTYKEKLGVDIFRPYNSALINNKYESKEKPQ
ncbi:MAG: EpsG family protein [Bacteroidales bacterium]|jgi:hypothetical protein|nr:EpsG family protein [Bacteroidales bacterium]